MVVESSKFYNIPNKFYNKSHIYRLQTWLASNSNETENPSQLAEQIVYPS